MTPPNMSASDQCYDAPRYWNLAFMDETKPEADFIEAAHRKYCDFPLRSILEPACGGGRQVLELASRGYHVTAFDLNSHCVRFTQTELKRRRLQATVFEGDMTQVVAATKADVAHCLVNSFRHLLTEEDAVRHLKCIAAGLRTGGLYLLGLHLLPPDAEEFDCERWTLSSRGTRVTTTVRVLSFDRRSRLETLRFSLKVTNRDRVLRLRSDYTLRIYRADQMRSLLRKVPQLSLVDVYDFCYDIADPLKLNDELGDTVLVLRKNE